MKKQYLYLIVSISGASVLALEILGTRILGPFYGVSIFLWSALITVTLAALSTGYLIGGWWADKEAKATRLSLLLAGAGVWVIFIPFITRPILSLMEPIGLRLSVLIAAIILFFPPLTLLGMISPYAIKIKTAHLDEVGRSAGNLYAISTLASVISALATGFFLIPNFGIQRLTLCIGFLLIATAIVIWMLIKKSKLTAGIALLLLFVLMIASWQLFAERVDRAEGLLFIKQSPYGEIRVIDQENHRFLMIDGAIHTMMNPETWQSHQAYAVVLDITKHLFNARGDMLLLGLGGGSVVKSFAIDGWKIDAVEIDPVVIDAAQKFFGLTPEEAEIFAIDGRLFLTTHTKKYDLVILDAFGSSSIPFHLVTKESFGLIASHLNSNGVLAVNVESVGWKSKIVTSLAATLKEHYEQILVLPIHEPPNVLGNVLILAANRNLEFPEEWLGHPVDYVTLDPYEHWVVVQRNHAWANRFVPDTKGIAVLTDDLNPIDIWSEEVNQHVRKDMHEYFKHKARLW